MKNKISILLVLTILILSGCRNAWPAGVFRPEETNTPTAYQTDSANENSDPVFSDPGLNSNPTESVSQTESGEETNANPTTSTLVNSPQNQQNTNEHGKDANDQRNISRTESVKPTDPPVTRPSETKPTESQPKETEPPAIVPKETVPQETEPPATEAPTEQEPTEPPQPEITYEFKRQVASYAAQYINAYRGSPCTVLPGMNQVAQYRASQLARNYGHSTSDQRAALAYYEYGRYIDAMSSAMMPVIPTGRLTLQKQSAQASTVPMRKRWASESQT